jgi:steroid 5-alpha reductase family enzyme
MGDLALYVDGLAGAAALALLTWLLSLRLRDVSIVDSLWSLMLLLQAWIYALGAAPGAPAGARARLTLALVTLWALRLSGYISWRNLGHGEDRRYQAIRARNQPHFALKSLYLVFLLQAVLAWIISLPLYGAVRAHGPPGALGPLDLAGAALWLLGFVFEAGADWQLARFKALSANQGKVMDRGLWRYTRHPNYFGEFCIWWGFYLLALAAGAWWSLPAPLLMSVLLIRVSGVTLLERDIGERRPEYAGYIRRTNAFFPGPPQR